MKHFDNTQLRPDEIAFNIVTNRPVGATRFTAFIDSMLSLGGAGALPKFNLEIEELSKGSIFGRLRIALAEDVEVSRVEALEREMARLRSKLDTCDTENLDLLRRQTIAAERAAQSSQLQADAAIKAARYLPITTALTALTLVATLASCAKDENPNRCSLAIAELMERDDVAAVQFWAKDCSYTATKQGVPEYQRRDWIAARQMGAPGHQPDSRTWIGSDGVVRTEKIDDQPGPNVSGGAPLGGSPLGSPEYKRNFEKQPVWAKIDVQRPGDAIPVRGQRSNAIHMTPTPGKIRFEGEMAIFEPVTGSDPRRAMVMVPAPDREFVSPNNQYLVRGMIVKTGDSRDLILTDYITVHSVGEY